jgi:hypothetical protein
LFNADRYDEIKSRFSQFSNAPKSEMSKTFYGIACKRRYRVLGLECLKDPQRDIRTLNVRTFKLWVAVKETGKPFQVS